MNIPFFSVLDVQRLLPISEADALRAFALGEAAVPLCAVIGVPYVAAEGAVI